MGRLRLAYNTNGLAHHRLGDAIDLLADLGYDGVALTPDIQHLDPMTAGAAEVAAVAAHLRRRGLDVCVQTGARFVLDPRRKHQPTLLDPDPTARARRLEMLTRCMDVARDLGAKVVAFWSGAGSAEGNGIEIERRLVDGAVEVAERARARGLVAAFEPEPGMHAATLADWRRLRDAARHPSLRLALDVGHVHCNREGDPATAIREHAADLADVQIEDMREGDHLHLAFGEGTLDPGPVIAALRDVRFAGLVGVELSRDSHRGPEVARAALDTLRRLDP
jgi:sugar phosphate isomerase/epimerase